MRGLLSVKRDSGCRSPAYLTGKSTQVSNALALMDWATLVSTRSKPEQHEVFITGHSTFVHPILQVYLDGTWPGWWTSDKKDHLVSQMLAELNPDKQHTLIRALQQLQWEEVPWIRCG